MLDIIIVLFGASGDICNRKVLPALYKSYLEREYNINKIIGYGRTKYSTQDYRNSINIEGDFKELFEYVIGSYDRYSNKLDERINELKTDNTIVLYYFGIPTYLTPNIIKTMNNHNNRYLIEKPIGNNGKECKEILNVFNKYIVQDNLYLIDHYLAKSSIKVVTKDVKKIKLILKEKNTVDDRLEYFDKVGIFLDMFQSHVLALLIYSFPKLFKTNNIVVNEIKKGQYKDYSGAKETDTYVYVDFNWDDINIIVEIGKAMNENKKILYYEGDDVNDSFDILSDNNEYKILFSDAIQKNKQHYLDSEDINRFWEITEDIIKVFNKADT